MKKIKVAIVGGTGYTGVELIRLLSQHPYADIQYLTSRTETGKRVGEFFQVCVVWWAIWHLVI